MQERVDVENVDARKKEYREKEKRQLDFIKTLISCRN